MVDLNNKSFLLVILRNRCSLLVILHLSNPGSPTIVNNPAHILTLLFLEYKLNYVSILVFAGTLMSTLF